MENNNIFKIRHSLAHVLAQAVQRVIDSNVQLWTWPVVENWFYYDMKFSDWIKFWENDLKTIDEATKKIVKESQKINSFVVSFDSAKKVLQKLNQKYKLELIEKFKNDWIENFQFFYNSISKSWKDKILHWIDENYIKYYDTINNLIWEFVKLEDEFIVFIDLCEWPHVENTKQIDSWWFEIEKTSSAYWQADEKNDSLTRIYWLWFETKQDLKYYKELLEEAKRRDHRELWKKLDLFIFSDLVWKWLPLWTERWAIIRRELERFIVDEEIKRWYRHVYTPDIANISLYKKSWHYPYYKESMYAPISIDDEEYMLRPMTCPHHFALYLSRQRSYKELPMRIAELAKLYRYEKSWELTWLIRVRWFCLADSHIICADENQAKQEINWALDLIEFVANIFWLKMWINYSYRLSLWDRNDDKKYYKNDESWDVAEQKLREVLTERKAQFREAEWEAAFYWPKIDVQMKNVMWKEDTAFTVQYDFVMPKRFELKYISSNWTEKECIVIHRSSIWAIERVVAFLVEHFEWAFPVWLSPVQVQIVSVADKFNEFWQKIYEKFKQNNIRVDFDNEDNSLNKKIRNAELMKIPYIVVVWEKEMNSNILSIREFKTKKQYEIWVDEFISQILEQIKNRSL